MFYIFNNSNFLSSITYKQRFVIFTLFMIFRDILILLITYLGVYLLLNHTDIEPLYLLSFYILIQIIPDFSEAKKTWRWSFFAPDYEWARACTPFNKEELSKLYFIEEMMFKLYGYLTGLVPITLIISLLCGVSFGTSLILGITLLIYKIALIFVIHRIYNIVLTLFLKGKTLLISFLRFIISSLIIIAIGAYIGKYIGEILRNAPFMDNRPVNLEFIKDWGILAIQELKRLFIEPFQYLLGDYTPWTYMAKKLLQGDAFESVKLFLGILAILFIVNYLFKYLLAKPLESFDKVTNTYPLEKYSIKISEKIINYLKMDPHLLLRIKLLFRHPIFAEKPFVFLGSMKSWLLLGGILGVLSMDEIPDLLLQLLIIEAGVVIVKEHVQQLTQRLRAVLSYDSDGEKTSLYFISPKESGYLFHIKTNLVRILALPGIVIMISIILLTGAFSLGQILLIVSLSVLSIWVYPALELLPGLLSPHFEIKNVQQIGGHSDQHISHGGISVIDYILHDMIRVIPIIAAVGWIPDFLLYPILISASLLLFILVHLIMIRTTRSLSKRIPGILSHHTKIN
ncbi:hypothetical protein PL1_0163 [Paenibacillus larvae subsp. larvae B-3650]|nr:hypothetical protein BXP28_17650 [Paenibacillus larvae subsp. larvae]PCK72574.1 hypothetical protein PL1_0163 [Paenibacillus larvae subsp. larvae B-3650]